ncbi:MAG: hypothetical protein V2A58_00065 [Planctomycetota bacterium]
MFDNLHYFPTRELLEAFLKASADLHPEGFATPLLLTFGDPAPDYGWIKDLNPEDARLATAFASQALIHSAMLVRAAPILIEIGKAHPGTASLPPLHEEIVRRARTVLFHPEARLDHRLATARLLGALLDRRLPLDDQVHKEITGLPILSDFPGEEVHSDELLTELANRWRREAARESPRT